MTYLITVLLLTALAPMTSIACSCIKFNAANAFKNAEHVFQATIHTAKVIDGPEDPATDSPLWGPLAIAEYDVLKVYKGRPESLKGVVTNLETPACGLRMIMGGTYVFFVYETWKRSASWFQPEYGIVTICGSPYYDGYDSERSTIEWLEENVSANDT